MHRRLADDIGRIGLGRRAVRAGQVPFAMHMGIDPARHDDFAGGVDHPRALRQRQAAGRRDRGDLPAGNDDVMRANALRRHHRIATDHQIDHCTPPLSDWPPSSPVRSRTATRSRPQIGYPPPGPHATRPDYQQNDRIGPGDDAHAAYHHACRAGAGMTADITPDSFVAPAPVGPLGAIQTVLNGINLVMAIGSAIAILVAGIVLTWEVMGRYFLGIASDWQDELSVFLLIGATFASAAWTQARRGHVGIEALSHVLPPGIDRVRRILADLIALLFCSFFAWKTFALLIEAWEEGQTTPSSWGPPLWIPYACMAFGMALLSLQLLRADPAAGAPGMSTLQIGLAYGGSRWRSCFRVFRSPSRWGRFLPCS